MPHNHQVLIGFSPGTIITPFMIETSLIKAFRMQGDEVAIADGTSVSEERIWVSVGSKGSVGVCEGKSVY
jgi:hypothetical protein